MLPILPYYYLEVSGRVGSLSAHAAWDTGVVGRQAAHPTYLSHLKWVAQLLEFNVRRWPVNGFPHGVLLNHTLCERL